MISRSILASASILKKWHTEHITSTRSCEGSLKWLKDQVVEGKFFGCLMEMWRALTSHVHLQKAGFVCSADEAKRAEGGQDIIDNEVAEYYGNFNLSTIEARLRRWLYMWGPPFNLLLVHHKDSNKVADFMRQWRKGVAALEKLQNMDERSAMQTQVLRIFVCSCLAGMRFGLNRLGK